MEAELVTPVTKSPLDSARGRGKVRRPRRETPKIIKPAMQTTGPTVIRIVLQNETSHLVEYNGTRGW